ncbi:MAG: hypothetical protein M1828_005790 [Chrysothrix sp. TS-e1954]|nr:MAG: hypothetical protein M1828_005790 [Chrysothrix sp. TS-e1954]
MAGFASLNPFASTPNIVTEVAELRVYPIKSCRGISIKSTTLTRQGLDFDRRWMFVDAETKKFRTIREISELTLVNTAFETTEDPTDPNGEESLQLVISIANTDGRVAIPARPSAKWLESNTTLEKVTIWGKDTDGYVYDESVNSMFAKFLGRNVALAYKGPTPRVVGGNGAPQELGRSESVNFPDVMPVQVANEASMHELNERLARKGTGEIQIENFRPNIIVRGDTSAGASDTAPAAWTEDAWKTVRISPHTESSWFASTPGALDIDVCARCARCQVPNVDPETAVKHKNEPWDTLVSYRRVDAGIKFKPCFGMLCCPRNEGTVAVGMKFEVTKITHDHHYIKGFN